MLSPKNRNNNTNLHENIASAVFGVWQEIGKENQIKVSGLSMSPIIKSGDVVTIKHNNKNIMIGEVIAFRKEQRIIIHRVIQKQRINNKLVFTTKGDYNVHLDLPVNEDEIIGKVITIHKGKRLLHLETIFWQILGFLIAQRPYLITTIYRRSLSLKTKFTRKLYILKGKII